MEEDTTFCDDERAIELSSIEAIFPEIVIDPSSKFKASLDIPVSPASPLKVLFQRPQTSLPSHPGDGKATDSQNGENTTQLDAEEPVPSYLSHLPPLRLDIDLPDGYPALKPPNFAITTHPDWLPPSRVAELIADGKRLWEECGKDLVVFAYIDHLQQLAEKSFELSSDPEKLVTLSRDLKIALMDFDMEAKKDKFDQETFECGVCLEPKKGANCHRMLLCSHVFCVPCLQGFYNSCIKEGDVDNVKCLAPDCGKDDDKNNQGENGEQVTPTRQKKKDRTLNPSELLQIPLEQEVVQRYVHLKRKRKLESDRTTVYCPRQWCQGAARSKRHPKPQDPINDDLEISEDEDEDNKAAPFDPLGTEDQLPPMSERLCICEDCGYAFCSVCKKGWHGELAFCYPRRAQELSAADKASEEYIKTYTAPCPTCDARCQKAMGCNHMICFKCNTHFCYLCSSWLFESNPYSHFNDPEGGCYMRLWELEEGHDSGPGAAPDWDRAAMEFQNEDSDEDGEDLEWEIARDDTDNRRNQRPPAPPAPPPARHRPPPPAPAPPAPPPANAVRPHRRGPDNGRQDDAAVRAAAAERQVQVRAIAEARVQQNGNHNNNVRNAQAGPRPNAGLQRFLHLVQNDQEDEWDSDELDDY
ncbi:hypothetical protein FQN50_006840 [Emmonsiellopsis sp. PD_5]|nr:hypothetical protein FQN50_006840 [Emmonsiellopsis sp. PD_5]